MNLSEKREDYKKSLRDKAHELSELLDQMQEELNTLPGFFRASITENEVLVIMDKKDLRQLFDNEYGPLSHRIDGVCFIGR